MIVKAWNNGCHHENGNGYGLKVKKRDRDAYFRRDWKVILLELEGESEIVEINIDKDSLWNANCRELISVRIGRWLKKNNLASWEKWKPPELKLFWIHENKFRVSHY